MLPRPDIGIVWQAARTTVAGGQLLTFLVNSPDMVQSLPPDEAACRSGELLLLHCLLGDGEFTWTSHLLLALLLSSVVSGFFPRLTGLLHVYAAFNVQTVLSTRDGGDQAALVLAVLMLPICLADDRRQAWSGHRRFGGWSAVSMLALRLQVAWIYGEAAIAKLTESTWAEGTAVAYWTQGIYFRPIDSATQLIPAVASTPAGTLTATYGAIVLELVLAVSLLLRPVVRSCLLPMTIGFHLLIGVTFGIWSFVLVMIGAALLLLGVPDAMTRGVTNGARGRILPWRSEHEAMLR